MTDHKRASDLIFMALVIWREARGESAAGKTAVAFSILNRVKRPSWWGKSVMTVVRKKWQYSSMTDPNDRQLTTWPEEVDPSWWECVRIADDVISGRLENPVPGADSYYDDSIQPPKWATKDMFVRKIGRLNFYNVDKDIEKQ